MHFSSAIITLLAAAGASATMDPLDAAPAAEVNSREVYPICPEGYNTNCCSFVFPYSNSCRRGRCSKGYGWSCIGGPGKVDSIRQCLESDEGKTAYCKRPGEEYFPSLLEWTGGSFKPIIEPSDYRQWVRPGMKRPWTPSQDEIRWEETEATVDGDRVPSDEGEASELRKRVAEQADVDLE